MESRRGSRTLEDRLVQDRRGHLARPGRSPRRTPAGLLAARRSLPAPDRGRRGEAHHQRSRPTTCSRASRPTASRSPSRATAAGSRTSGSATSRARPRARSAARQDQTVNAPAWSPDGEYLVGRKRVTDPSSLGTVELWMWHIEGRQGRAGHEEGRPARRRGSGVLEGRPLPLLLRARRALQVRPQRQRGHLADQAARPAHRPGRCR